MAHEFKEESFRTIGDFVMQSTPKNVAIIMDGNRRWALEKGLPATAGHRQGVTTLEHLLPAFRQTDVHTLTLFGFSSANWQRSELEVTHLMQLAEQALLRFTPRCIRERLRIEVIGRKDRLPVSLLRGIELAQNATAHGTRRLRIALDYSSRTAILDAAVDLPLDCEEARFSDRLSSGGDVDLLIRTGKEQRLSDFLLWECAFAELYFPDLYWPDFDAGALHLALDWYGQRNRRFGQ